jgi:hypothetical protein
MEQSSSYNCPPHVSILSQRNPVHNPTSYLLKIHLKYYLPIYAWVSQVASFPMVLPQKPCTRLSPPHLSYILHPFHYSRFYHAHNSVWGVQIMQFLIMKFPPTPVTSSLLGPNTFLNTLFSNTLSLRSPSMSPTKFHTHKKQAKL